jgi:hypothetical protein
MELLSSALILIQAPNGYDDIIWDKDERLPIYEFIMPHSFLIMSIVAGLILFVVVLYKRR